MNISALVDSLGRDLRYSLRGLLRRPSFTLAVVLTLALGIGANTAIFSVLNSVLLKPLGYPQPDELVSLKHSAPGLKAPGVDSFELDMGGTSYFTYRDEGRTFQSIGLYTSGSQSLTGQGDPEQVRAIFATSGVLQALGVRPLLGRSFVAADDAPNAEGPQPVVLTYAYWQRKFGGDAAVIGRALSMDSRASQVVGVMPAGFRFLDVTPEPEVIAKLPIDATRQTLGDFNFQGLARLKPGVTLAEAEADIKRMLPIWLEAWPNPPNGMTRDTFRNWHIAPALRPLKDQVVRGVANMLWVLMGMIGAVLLIACANVANLLLVRADVRRPEIAIRTALGAGPRRIAKDVLVESSVLGAAGGALGVALAYAGVRTLVATGPTNLPRLAEISFDPAVVAFAIGASLLATLLFGSVAALKHAAQIRAPLRAGAARGASTSRERHWTRNTLVVVQVALAFVLLVSSGLMIRTFQALSTVDPGFTAPDQVQTARIAIPEAVTRDPKVYTRTERAILENIAALPGVESAAFAVSAPMEGWTAASTIFVEGNSYAAGETPPVRRFKWVSPGYFATLGTRLIAGRDLTWDDLDQGGKVAVISENVAREIWGDPAAALGKRIRETAPSGPGVWREVIGVAQDLHEDALDKAAPPLVYWPVLMEGGFGGETFGNAAVAYLVRSARAGNDSLVREIRQAVWSVNASLPVFLVRTLQDLYAASLARTSFTLVLLGIAGALALGLGVIGIYGVMAYVVSQRTREIGIRLALGAQPLALTRMFVWRGLALAGGGIAAGLAVAVGLTRLMASLLYGVGPLDLPSFAAALSVVLCAAALASWLPARGAATIDPVDTLRAE